MGWDRVLGEMPCCTTFRCGPSLVQGRLDAYLAAFHQVQDEANDNTEAFEMTYDDVNEVQKSHGIAACDILDAINNGTVTNKQSLRKFLNTVRA